MLRPMVLILNGPNLNLLGRREPELYGGTTLEELEALCEAWGAELGLGVVFRQSNYEGQLIDWVQQAHEEGFLAIVLNPGETPSPEAIPSGRIPG
jgi:3-dehydroquinate dehydratase-2